MSTWHRITPGTYENGTHRIERDNGSLDEFDSLSDPEWFVYVLPLPKNYGPPDSIAEFPTLKRAKKFIDD